jgi:pimeloyl-ACP methyl ester carboxylesterase
MPAVADVRHRFVRVDGVRLHVAEAGDPDAPAVLLLHGFPQHWYMWRHVLGPLAQSRHVIAIDFRGFGWSDAPRRGYSTAARVRDVIGLLDQLSIDRADLVGHDWGALVGFYAALDHPDRVNRLVAISMVHLWPMQRHLAPSTWRWWVTALFEWPVLGTWLLRKCPQLTGWLLARDAASPEVWTPALRARYASRLIEPSRARAGQRLHAGLILAMPRLLLGRDRNRPFDVPNARRRWRERRSDTSGGVGCAGLARRSDQRDDVARWPLPRGRVSCGGGAADRRPSQRSSGRAPVVNEGLLCGTVTSDLTLPMSVADR